MKTINSKKLLPSGQDKKQVFLVPVNSIIPSKPKLLSGVKPEKKDDDSKKSSVISEKISDVTKLLRYGLLLRERDKRRKRRAEERKKRNERERELETKKLGKKGQQEKQAVNIPGSSIFDRLMRFAGFTLLGFLFNNFGRFLPAFNAIGSVLKPAAVGIMNFAEGLLSNTVDWIEKGYKAYDAVSEFTKEIGGENFQKLFNDFSGALTLAINGVIIAGAAALRGGLFKRTGGIRAGGTGAAGGAALRRRRATERREINQIRKMLTQMGDQQRKNTRAFIEKQLEIERRKVDAVANNPVFQKNLSGKKVKFIGGSGTSGTATASKPSSGTGGGKPYFGDLPSRTGKPGDFVSNTRKKMGYADELSSLFGPTAAAIADDLNVDLAKTDAENRIAQDIISGKTSKGSQLDSLLGKPPTPGRIRGRGIDRILPRAILKTTGSKALAKVAGKIPVIGPLVDFVISVILGDRPDKAAAGAVGAAIGAAVGTFIPIPFVGTILGGIAGDIIGRSLYDVVLKMTGMSAEKFNKGGIVGPPPPVSPPPPISKEKKEKEPEPGLFKDSLGSLRGKEIYGGGDKEEYEKVFGIIKGTYDSILDTSGGFISSLMAGAIGLLSGNDFDENLLRYIGDRYGISAVNGMRDLSNRAKGILNQQSFNFLRRKREPGVDDAAPGSAAQGDANVSPITLDGKGSLTGLNEQDFRDLAFIVSAEAQRGTDDEYGVAANVLTRVADPGYPNSIKAVGAQPDQYEAVFTGKAYDDPELAAKLASPQGQAKIAEAMKKLRGRTEFKGTSMYQYMGESDIKFSSRGNFYHYASQQRKSDPVPEFKPTYYRKFIKKAELEEQASNRRGSGVKDIAMTPAYNSIELHTVLVQPVIVS